MSFYKNTLFSIEVNDYEIIDSELIKTAAFKLPSGVVYDPDFLYMWVKGVSSGETWGDNKNADYFPRHELKGGYKTFLTAHVFKNHENKDIKNAIGDVLESVWNEPMDCVKLLLRIDNKIAPSVVRGFQKGYMTDVSMGCRVDHSICSICGNKAKTPKEYCEHIRFNRGQIYEDGRKVYEINMGPKFHDISTVLNGAEKTAKAISIYLPGEETEELSTEKTASFKGSTGAQKIAFMDFDSVVKAKSGIDLIGRDLFPDSLMSKKAYTNKVAELKKEIDATIESIADKDVTDNLVDDADASRTLLRMVAENYWDEDKCLEIVDILREIAKEKGESTEVIFCQFLDILSFTGCELSPKEFSMISDNLFELMPSEHTELYDEELEDDFATAMKHDALKNHRLGSLLDPAIRAIIGGVNGVPEGVPNPIRGITILAVMPKGSVDDYTATPPRFRNDIMKRFLPHIRERSVFSPSMLHRVKNKNNNEHFWMMPDNPVKQAMYMLYQNGRTSMFASPEYLKSVPDFIKTHFIHEKAEMNKTASLKSAVISLPVVFGYSAYQRARMQNGENINSVNKFIADNPASAYVLQAIFAPKAFRKSMTASKKIKSGAKKVYWDLVNSTGKIKAADVVYGNLEKTADTIIDYLDIDRVYTDDQSTILKTAGLMSKAGHDDASQIVLSKSGLDDTDLEKYIHICKNAVSKNISDCLRKEARIVSSLEKIYPTFEFDRIVMQIFSDEL